MRKIYLLAVLFSASLFYSCTDSGITPDSATGNDMATIVNMPTDAVKGELFVKFKPEVEDILDEAGVLSRSGNMSRSNIPSVDEVLDIAGAYKFERIFPVDKKNESRTRDNGLHLWYWVRFDKDADLMKVAQDMAKLTEVATVQFNREIKRSYNPNIRAKAVSETTIRVANSLKNGEPAFNDPRLADQWHYINDGTILNKKEDIDENPNIPEFDEGTYAGNDVNCDEAWTMCKGDPSIIVAVLDEGVMYTHEDLEWNMWTNESETIGSSTDADGNGYKGDRHGYNFVADTGLITWGDPNDTGHGTHVAGTIAAVNGNDKGVCGIAGGDGTENSGVKIMSCQIFAGNAGVTLLAEAKAVKYAADNGAVILQCSWGYNSAAVNPTEGTPGPATDEEWVSSALLEKEVMDYFINNAGDPNGVIEGGIIVFAAGNEYSPLAGYPGAYKDFISVASVGPDGLPAPYSNYGTPSGSKNMISAPGGDGEGTKRERALVLSTMPMSAVDMGGSATESGYGYMEGTSMACPHVSGVAALGLSYAAKLKKHFRAEDYRRLLLESVQDMDSRFQDKVKSYWKGWSFFGDAAPHYQLDLNNYRGKVGGLIDAGKVLKNVENGEYGSQPMKIPNVYVKVGAEQKIDLTRIFSGVTQVTCEVSDQSVAEVSIDATSIIVKGLSTGVTKAIVNVTTVDGTLSQTFVITVRNTSGDGWM